MKSHTGLELSGPYGTAVEVCVDEYDRPDQEACLASWFLDCPGQSPAWRHYSLSVIHLRPIEGVRPAHIRVPGATHELVVFAIDPACNPTSADPGAWSPLRPINVTEQFTVHTDDAAYQIAAVAVRAVLEGVLPAEPALAGAVEPWRTSIIKTSAHMRGEEHAP